MKRLPLVAHVGKRLAQGEMQINTVCYLERGHVSSNLGHGHKTRLIRDNTPGHAQAPVSSGLVRRQSDRFFERLRRLLEPAERAERVAESGMRFDVLRFDGDCPFAMCNSLFGSAEHEKHVAEAVVNIGIVRGGGECLLVLREPLFLAAQSAKRMTYVEVSLGIVRADRERLLVMDKRLFMPPEVVKQVAEIVVSFGIVGADGKRLLVLGDGLVGAAELLQRVAEIVASFGVIRLDCIRPLVMRDRRFCSAENLQRMPSRSARPRLRHGRVPSARRRGDGGPPRNSGRSWPRAETAAWRRKTGPAAAGSAPVRAPRRNAVRRPRARGGTTSRLPPSAPAHDRRGPVRTTRTPDAGSVVRPGTRAGSRWHPVRGKRPEWR